MCDLVYDMNFNALKLFKNSLKKKQFKKIQAKYSHKIIYWWPSTYMQDMREIPAIVNEEIAIKCGNFHTFGGGISLVMALANRRTNRFACLNAFSSSIDKVSFKKTACLWALQFWRSCSRERRRERCRVMP